MSVDVPAAVMSSEVAFSQPADPPLGVGVVGGVRSSRTVPAAATGTGVHAEALPTTSRLRSSTSVSPSAATCSDVPETGCDQLPPPSIENRCSYPAKPEPASIEPDAEIVRDAAVLQASAPPATAGADGGVRSSWTLACVQVEARPALSSAWKRTSVVPSAEIEVDAP